ncbi:MAG: hypothetical protein VW771_07790, partial [Gammaproteobacteria bacterium]
MTVRALSSHCTPTAALRSALLALIVIWGNGASLGDALEQADDRGSVITLPAPAMRVVSLAPHLTEILFDIGAGDRLVGVMAFSDFPEAARLLPRVGNY